MNASEHETDGRLTLVIGIDGSGKTTFVDNLAATHGYEIYEPTSTPEVRALKQESLELPVTEDFIDRREALFVGLNNQFNESVDERRNKGANVVTSGGNLTTFASHSLMRCIVAAREWPSVPGIIDSWESASDRTPDDIVLIHAPFDVILERIRDRQRRGDKSEKFWGFNSPTFLSHYQELWHQIVSRLADTSGVNCLKLDSSTLRPHEMIRTFTENTGLNPGGNATTSNT